MTNTLYESSKKLLPVLFIFISVYITYGVLGHELYGHELFHFRSLFESMSTLALMMVGENLELYYQSKCICCDSGTAVSRAYML